MSAISCATKLPIEGHRPHGVRRAAGRGADPDVVEGDHTSMCGERVDERGVPVVEVAAEVLQQDERNLSATDVAGRVLDPILGRDPLRQRVRVGARRFSRACSCVLAIVSPSHADAVAAPLLDPRRRERGGGELRRAAQ